MGMPNFKTLLLCLLLSLCAPAAASYAYYVGKDLTAEGIVLVGGTGEEVSSHWLEIVPRRQHPAGSTITVGATGEAALPGVLTQIPQARVTFRYLTMNYSDYKGLPAPLTNGGLNEHGLAVRDVWSPSRKELVDRTPSDQKGPQYSDLARIALERARTAREAVEILGSLIDRYGYTTYGGNSHLFADAQEGWVMIEFAGGEGLWVAERLGSDEVRFLYPGYIEEVPLDYQSHPDFMGSKNLISFAQEQGWYDPDSGEPFNAYQVYGRNVGTGRTPGLKLVDPKTMEDELRALAPRITVKDMMKYVRDPRVADDEAGYGQVVALSEPAAEPGLLKAWVAPTSSVTAPFLPWYLGAEEVAPEFGRHRYLSKDAGSTFLHPDFAGQEATLFAGRVFKRLLYHTAEHPEAFLAEVTSTFEAFEEGLLNEQSTIESTAALLYKAQRPELARRYLTFYCNTRAQEGLRLGLALVEGIEARTRALYKIRRPRGEKINLDEGESVNVLPEADPDQP